MEDINQQILDKISSLKDAMIHDILEVVKVDSVEREAKEGMPFGEGVAKALDTALTIAKRLGFTTHNLDGYMGWAQYGEGDDYIGIIGHLDVVPVGDGWLQPPFSGYVDEHGRIFSRGILDNKGPIMTCLYALYAIKELGLKLSKPVRILFGTDEETGFTDLTYYLKHEKPPVMGFTPDCKYPVVYGERGRAILSIRADIQEHPVEVTKEFFNFVNTYFLASNNNGDRLGINFSDEEFGLMVMRGYQLENSEDALSFRFSLSYPASCTLTQIMDTIKAKLSEHLQISLIHNYDPVRFEKDCFLVRSLQEAYEEVTGNDGTPVTTTGGTYAKGMPNIVPFGPSFPGQKGIGHNPNEWMDIADLMSNAKIYALSIYKLAK